MKYRLHGDIGICLQCGLSHEQPYRLKALRRMLPCGRPELLDAYPCWWGGKSGYQRLREDLRAVGARLERESVASRKDGRWFPAVYVLKLALAGH